MEKSEAGLLSHLQVIVGNKGVLVRSKREVATLDHSTG